MTDLKTAQTSEHCSIDEVPLSWRITVKQYKLPSMRRGRPRFTRSEVFTAPLRPILRVKSYSRVLTTKQNSRNLAL